jgi:large conductance mechanosensitive channel
MDPLKKISALDPTKKAFLLVEEFRNFALKGNVIDLAVGVIIGAAFGKIIDSLVKHIIMPLISLLVPGQQSYLDWKIQVGEKVVPYGLFLGEVVNFLIIALALFLFIVKFLGWVMRTKKEEAVAPPPPTRDQELLMEIRDLLKKSRPSPDCPEPTQ